MPQLQEKVTIVLLGPYLFGYKESDDSRLGHSPSQPDFDEWASE